VLRNPAAVRENTDNTVEEVLPMFPSDFDGAPQGPTSPLEFRRRESERSIYTEKKLGDEWVALWTLGDLPEDANVIHVTVIPYRGERGVIPWKAGRSSLPEGDVQEGESAEAAIRRLLLEQVGIQEATPTHLGHFVLKATTLNKKLQAGTVVYDAFYVAEVASLADNPGDQSYERRIVLQREINEILRGQYIERRREYTDTLDRWLLARLKAARVDN
jgi:ADP-ribose pyrophosphatase YjhB (NUDIX family)